MSTGEMMVEANGVELCVEAFGDVNDPTVLLIHGASASMLWWDRGLCEKVAATGRRVIRYDHRDTGRSVSCPPGQPNYSLRDMAEDAVGILDAFDIDTAHIVACSMSGAIGMILALDHADRVASLTLVSTSPGGEGLPSMSPEFVRETHAPAPEPSDTAAVAEYIVGLTRAYAGGSPYFDEAVTRALVEQDIARTRNVASCMTNHFLIDFGEPLGPRLSDIDVPTLVVHGDRDPVFPLAHGQALQRIIPNAELLVLPNAGHEVPEPLWSLFVDGLMTVTSTT